MFTSLCVSLAFCVIQCGVLLTASSLSSLRMLLHKSSTPQSSCPGQRSQSLDLESLRSARSLARKVLEESLLKLQEEPVKSTRSIRWELGACWVQHLQNQASGKNDSKKAEESKPEPAVKGLGKQGGLLKELKKKTDGKGIRPEQNKESTLVGKNDNDDKPNGFNQKEHDKLDQEKEMIWKSLIPEAAYVRLKESETGLHLQVYLLVLSIFHLNVFNLAGKFVLSLDGIGLILNIKKNYPVLG